MKVPVFYQIECFLRDYKLIKKLLKAEKRPEEILGKYKYIHVMNNGIHSINILQFINKYFDDTEHCFIFPVLREETKGKIAGIKNVYPYELKDIPLDSVKKIVFHGLFTLSFVDFLYKNQEHLEKSYWFIWGGDLYDVPDTVEHNFVRSNMAGVLTSFDKKVYERKYGKCNKYFDVTYPHSQEDFDLLESRIEKSEIVHIQVNNSADKTTLEMLDILKKYKNENIKVSTVLSYVSANQKDIRLQIMKKGYDIFGNKFNPIIDFLPKDEYNKHLSSVDIYISNQDRQQGNGNASVVCARGGKAYTKRDTSVYIKYNALGIKYYDTYSIKKMSFKEFVSQDKKIVEKSVKKLKHRMKDSTKVKQWGEFFLAD